MLEIAAAADFVAHFEAAPRRSQRSAAASLGSRIIPFAGAARGGSFGDLDVIGRERDLLPG
jgi:hypothetical protein